MRKITINFIIFIGCVLFFFAFGNNVKASYDSVCNKGEIVAKQSTYKKCGTGILYLYEEDKSNSSYLVSNKNYGSKDQVLYAGIVDGLDTFYAAGFDFYSVVYDDRGF